MLARKAELLPLLRPTPTTDGARACGELNTIKVERERGQTLPAKPVCRCGSLVWRDVKIHAGQCVRRDRRCGRFLDFVRWYGRPSVN